MTSAAQKKRIKSALSEARSNPQDPSAKAKVAQVWIDQGKPEVALSWAVEAARLAPSRAEFKALLERTSRMVQGLEEPPKKLPKPTSRPKRISTRVRVWDEATEVDDATVRAPAPVPPRAWEEITEPQSKEAAIPTARLAVGPRGSSSQFIVPDTAPIPRPNLQGAKSEPLSTLELRSALSAPVARSESLAAGPDARASALEPMAQLLCGSLFPIIPSQDPRSVANRRSVSWRSVAGLSLLAGLATILGLGVQTGIRAKTHRQVTVDLEDFRHQLNVGSLESVAQVLPELQGKIEVAKQKEKYAKLVVFANAILYRYHDADPRRAKLVRAALAKAPSEEHQLVLARALTRATVDRIGMIESLRAQKKSAEGRFLLATALERVGDRARAEEAYEQAEALEPAHLQRLVHAARRSIDDKELNSARNLVDQLRDIDPEFVGIRLLERELAPVDEAAALPKGLAPVRESQAVFREALRRLGRGQDASVQLEIALSKVHFQREFALDYADALLHRGHALATRTLMRIVAENGSGSSRSSAWEALEARVGLRVDGDAQSASTLKGLLERGFWDPAAAADYLNHLPPGALDAKRTAAVKLLKRWPEHRALSAALSRHREVPKRRKARRKRRRRRR